jgi:recombination protein RecA
MALGFLKDFRKNVEKLSKSISLGLRPPRGWWSTGNYALNKAFSGSFTRAIPIGRMVLLAGPSASGKSFMANSIAKHAQVAGAHVLYMDSENAVDTDYMTKIGMKVDEENLTYVQVDTVEDVNRVISEFFDGYIKTYGVDNDNQPPVLVILDSIAMLSTETEQENFDKKGEIKADQGIRAKRIKAMLRMMVKKLARVNGAGIATDHVYPQDVMAGDGAWAITNSIKFAMSIIGIVTKLNLKEDTDIVGVRMRFMTYKSRFAKNGTKVELEVPYDRGMSPFTGLEEMLTDMGVIVKEGHSYVSNLPTGQIKFKWKDIDQTIFDKLLTHPLIQKSESDGTETFDESDKDDESEE